MAKRHWAVFENQEKNRHLCSRLTIAAQKLYRLLPRKAISSITGAERNVLNIGLKKFRPGQSEPILVGGEKLLKPALRLMRDFRLRIDEIKGAEVVASYYPVVGIRGNKRSENSEVYLACSPNFERSSWSQRNVSQSTFPRNRPTWDRVASML